MAAATATTTTEELPQDIQAPSPTCPGTTYPIRVSLYNEEHVCIYIYILYVYIDEAHNILSKWSIDEAHNILSKIIHSFDIFPYIPICPWLHFPYIPIYFLYIPICPGLNPLYIPHMSMVIPSLLSTLCGLLVYLIYYILYSNIYIYIIYIYIYYMCVCDLCPDPQKGQLHHSTPWAQHAPASTDWKTFSEAASLVKWQTAS